MARTNKVLIIALVLFLSFGLSVFAEANLLTNPGFETGDFAGWDPNNSYVLDENSHNGIYHARIGTESSGAYGGIYQSVEVMASESYKLTAWAYMSDGGGGGVVRLDFYDSEFEYLNTAWFQYLEELPRNEYNFVDSGWLTAPDDAAYAVVMSDVMADFYADFDNFDFSPIPEPSSLLLLGTGLLSIFGFGLRRKR